MANQLSSNTLFGGGYNNRLNLERVKNNTPCINSFKEANKLLKYLI